MTHIKHVFIICLIGIVVDCSSSSQGALTQRPVSYGNCLNSLAQAHEKDLNARDTNTTQCLIGCAQGYLYSLKTGLCYAEAGLNTTLQCESYPEDVCEAAGCAYNRETFTCSSPLQSTKACASQPTQSACSQTPNCVWIPVTTAASSSGITTGVCESNGFSSCNNLTTAATCNTSICVWDPARLSCDSVFSACGIINNEKSCNLTSTCHWNSSNSDCESGFARCSSYSQSSCQLSSWCTWDSGSNTCISLTTGSCSAATNSTICGALSGCVWDATANTCLSPNISSCSSAGTQKICSQISACAWDSTSSECLSTITTGCSSTKNQAVCGALKTCIWDSANSLCLPNWSCSSLGNEYVLGTNTPIPGLGNKALCDESSLCGYSASQQCISKVWCWWYGDCT